MTLLQGTVWLTFGILMIAIFIALIRLILGPSLPDRVVALDLISTLVIGIIAAHILLSGQTAFLSIAIVLALVSFLGTIAFAHYLEKKYS